MGRNRRLLAFFLAILFAVGAIDGIRSIGKYAYRRAPGTRNVQSYRRVPGRLRRQVGRNPPSDTISGDGSTRLVQSLGYQPQSVCNPVDTPIEFDITLFLDASGKTDYVKALAELEFRLWEYGDKWSVVYDWRPWPLPPYRASAPGSVALQVDIRRKDEPKAIDRRWLNQFSFLSDCKPYRSNLFRCLIAMHFDVLDEEKLDALLADELQLVVALLHNDQLALDHGEQVRRLGKLRCVGRIAPDGPHNDRITLRSGSVFHWDWHACLLQEEGKGVAPARGRCTLAGVRRPLPTLRKVAGRCGRGGGDSVFRAIGLLLRNAARRGFVERSGFGGLLPSIGSLFTTDALGQRRLVEADQVFLGEPHYRSRLGPCGDCRLEDAFANRSDGRMHLPLRSPRNLARQTPRSDCSSPFPLDSRLRHPLVG